MPTPGQPGGHQPGGHQPGGHLPDGGGGGGGGVGSAALSGSALSNLREAGVVAGGKQIIITLTDDTWIADITAQRQAIIDGLTSSSSETNGWNNEVRDKEVVTAVERTSDTVVTITLTAAPAYNITDTEVVEVTIPAAALVGAAEIVATPNIAIAFVKGMVAVSGRKPRTKKISVRSITHAVSGAETPYPVYRFSNKHYVEKPKHNPFKGL